MIKDQNISQNNLLDVEMKYKIFNLFKLQFDKFLTIKILFIPIYFDL